MTLRDDLIAAKALIDTPEKWVKGRFCGDGYCALGACERAASTERGTFAHWRTLETARALGEALPDGMPQGWTREAATVAAYNDLHSTSHNDILALFDRAIKASEPAQ